MRALKAIYKKALEDVCERLEISNGKIDILLSEIDNADDVTLSVLQSQIYSLASFRRSRRGHKLPLCGTYKAALGR